MFKVRVIPCLDVKDGRVVKGVLFLDLRDAGDPVAAAVAPTRISASSWPRAPTRSRPTPPRSRAAPQGGGGEVLRMRYCRDDTAA
jgi:hypothetical protein